MSEIQKQILDFLKRNRVSTTEVADCLGKTGVLDDYHPVNSGMYSVGVITTSTATAKATGASTSRPGTFGKARSS